MNMGSKTVTAEPGGANREAIHDFLINLAIGTMTEMTINDFTDNGHIRQIANPAIAKLDKGSQEACIAELEKLLRQN
jgi:hypothetical protein